MRKTYFALIMLAGLLLLMAAPALSIEYIIQYDDGITAYYSGRPQTNDTCGVWFEPPTESQIISGLFQFNGGMGGDAYLYLWYLAPDFDPDNYYDSDEPNASPGPSPLGDMICGPILYTFDNSGEWQEIVYEDFGVLPEDLDVGLENFYLGYVLAGGGAQPYYPSILGDAADDRPYHSLCYLTDPGGSYPGESGWWAYGIDWMIRAKVDLYGDPPPFIEDLADPPDTYTAGPYTITATIVDMDTTGAPGSGQVTEARLIYSVDGGDEVTVIMTAIDDTTYAGDVAAVGVGSTINFRVEADDNAAHTAIAPSLAGYNFTYRSHSGATILLVNDSGGNADETVYMNALEGNGFSYDYWYIDGGSPDDMGYPGSDVISTANYRTIIWFNGTATTGNLPDNDADLTVDPVANFMDDGGNFFLSSSDYIGGAFNPDVWTEFTETIPGTFMREYLMVESGWSDSHPDTLGESQDTLYFGILDDPISGDYTGGFYNYPDPNYNDYVNPLFGIAETCFETEIDNESAGIRYDGAFKMVFLPWVLEACEDPAVAEGILLNVLEYFNEGAGPGIVLLQGSRYGIYSNVYAPTYPGDVPHRAIAQVTDPDGVASVSISIRWDDGDWASYNMGNIGNDQYRYIFTDPGGWDDMHYRVVATDNLGNVSVGPEYECWTTGLEYTAGNTFLFCSDQPYEWLIGENFDPKVTTKLDQLSIPYAIWDVDEYSTPDFWTVLNKYQHCFWVGYADWDLTFPVATEDNPFYLYLASGKNLLFSSEEQLGVWTDWVDTKFAEGNFAYDWMGVDSLVNDVGYTEVNLSDPPDQQCSGMADPCSLETLYWDPMGDLLTPTDFGVPTLFYGNGWWCGFRDDDPQHNRTVLGFSLFQLPQAQADIFVWNVYSFWINPANQGYSIGVEPEEEGETPITYDLKQNYPNPFNPVTQIHFSLPEFTRVELTIYNLMGQEVARLLDREMAIGHYVVTWDASQFASGVYFYKLKTTNFESVRKMIMIK